MKFLLTVFVSFLIIGVSPAQDIRSSISVSNGTTHLEDNVYSESIIIRPHASQKWTGHVKKSVLGTFSNVDGEITVGKDLILQTIHRGYAAFDITGIPANAIITQITLTAYTSTASSSTNHTVYVKKLGVDPVATQGESLYNSIGDGSTISDLTWKPMTSSGYKSAQLNSTAIWDLQNFTNQQLTRWYIGFQEYQDNDGYGIFDGWNYSGGPEPYCVVQYTIPTYLINITPSSLLFGEVQVGQYSDETITIENESNISTLYGNISIDGSGFIMNGGGNYYLAPGQSKTVSVRFSPAAAGNYSGNVAITHNATNLPSPVNIPLTGTGAVTTNITVAPQNLSFGDVQVGTYSEKTVTVTNGPNSTGNLSGSISVSGNPFSITSGEGSYNLEPGQSKIITVRFTPSSGTTYNDSLTIAHNAVNSPSPLKVPVSGQGITSVNITVTPQILEFDTVKVGQYSDKTIIITNGPNSTANLTGIVSVDGSGFTILSGAGNYDLSPGQNKMVTVRFTPSQSGFYTGSITVTHNAGNGSNPASVSLSGSGQLVINMACNSSSVSFLNTIVGVYSEQTIKIKNELTSGSNLTGTVTISGENFELTYGGGNYELVPGEEKEICIRFTPTFFSIFMGALTITHNATNYTQNPYVIPVSANAILGIEDLEFLGGVPEEYSLYQNYPNPFNPSTRIQFDLPEETIVDVSIYDITGALIQNLLEKKVLGAGKYSFNFNAKDLPSGIYLYVYHSVSLNSQKETFFAKKMLLMK